MRTYGRVTNSDGSKKWVQVNTDSNGMDSYVWLTTLCQTLLGVLGESPFYAQYGIPSIQSVLTQVYPNYFVQRTQQQYSQYFASLQISKATNTTPNRDGSVDLIYNVSAILLDGTVINTQVAI